MVERVNSYRELLVWQNSIVLAEECYALTRGFPRDELFGLTQQTRRAACSIASNIAEGYGRESTRYFIHFLRIGQGSLKELETHLIISERVAISGESAIRPLLERCDELGKMLRALIRSLQAKKE